MAPMLLLHQVTEDALEGVIQWLDSAQADFRRLRETWELDLECADVATEDDDRAVGIDADRIDGVELNDRRGERARCVADHAHVVWPLVERRADGAESAGRGELAIDDEQDGVRELLDFLEDVRREDDRPPICGQLLEQALEVHALTRV